ncbi:AAA family ATPase [Microbacterium sp. NPDC089321]|uniref:AAA family ATPase n=1 Tax=Microbacterium sp. NPDC089321 TaxID=3155183 RepID=UPI003430D030
MLDTNLNLIHAEATNVLGEYYHQVTFPAAQDFLIVYGPNGVGKTKFLEIIHYMSRLDATRLSRMPFESATLTYSDGTVLRVEGKDLPVLSDKRSRRRRLRFQLSLNGKHAEKWDYNGDSFEEWFIENTPWRPYGDGELWEDQRDGELVTLDELQRRHPANGRRGSLKIPTAFRTFAAHNSSYLIETQRLRIEQAMESRGFPNRHGRRPEHTSKIAEHAAKMRSLVNEAQTEHSTITQQRDRDFPNRVLAASSEAVDAESVRERYESQNKFRSRLGRVASVDLADALSLPDKDLDPFELRLLDLYLDDAEAKLAPFRTLLEKIELLEEVINSRLLRKRLEVTAKDGLSVKHLDDDRLIDLNSLSSGEQHEIILMFDLLFNVREGALVLIDEPEISLHVVWQLAFIPDVQKIAALADFRFLVATHSPQIINDAWDQAYPLGPAEEPFV